MSRRKVPPNERFKRHVKVTDSCHLWQGAVAGKGYGVFGVDGRLIYAHRFSYEQVKGKIPAGLCIDHLCRNIICVNPDHLEAVTYGENIRRGLLPSIIKEQKAAITHCPGGHEYTEENTYKRDGKRHCKACQALHVRKYEDANRERRNAMAREHRRRKACAKAANIT